MNEYNRPPLGVMPKNIWDYKRMQELSRAIYEYIDTGYIENSKMQNEHVKNWIIELYGLVVNN